MENNKIDPSFTVFEELVGHRFSLQSGDQIIHLTLTEATRLPPATTREDLGIQPDPFKLLFKEAAECKLQQQIYTTETDAGIVDLFLVPVGFGEYQAIFN